MAKHAFDNFTELLTLGRGFMTELFSDFWDFTDLVTSYGAFDISLVNDLPLL